MVGRPCHQAIILAAGLGSRLLPMTAEAPKPLTKVNGTPILHNALSALRRSGIQTVTLVVGYKKEMIQAACRDFRQDIAIEFIESEAFDRSGSAHSLWLARDVLVRGDTVVIEGDVFFDDAVLARTVAASSVSTAAVASFTEAMTGSAVLLGKDRLIAQLLTKQDFATARARNLYKTINIMRIRQADSETIIVPELARLIETNASTAYVEQCLSHCIANRALRMTAQICDDLKWYEIDDLSDLRVAEAMFGVESAAE